MFWKREQILLALPDGKPRTGSSVGCLAIELYSKLSASTLEVELVHYSTSFFTIPSEVDIHDKFHPNDFCNHVHFIELGFLRQGLMIK